MERYEFLRFHCPPYSYEPKLEIIEHSWHLLKDHFFKREPPLFSRVARLSHSGFERSRGLDVWRIMMDPPNSFDGGLLLAAILISILLLPISILFFSPIEKKDEVLVESPANGTEQNSVANTSVVSIASDDSKVDTVVSDVAEDDTASTRSYNDKSNWRCACEGGFLPPGLFGNMESVLKMGSGQCYHKPAA
jgi:hypothetical protein